MPASSIARSMIWPGGPDEGAADRVLLIARLLTDEHHRRVRRPFAEHRLRRRLIQRAATAGRRVLRASRSSAGSGLECRTTGPSGGRSGGRGASSKGFGLGNRDVRRRLFQQHVRGGVSHHACKASSSSACRRPEPNSSVEPSQWAAPSGVTIEQRQVRESAARSTGHWPAARNAPARTSRESAFRRPRARPGNACWCACDGRRRAPTRPSA